MWVCIKCKVGYPFSRVEPSIDDFGIYFMCPNCGRRNRLINVGKRGRIALMQQERQAKSGR
jgi:hypothetical protein